MAVNVCLPLFGDPGRELEAEREVRSKELRALADTLGERLRQAADTLDRLTADGWKNQVATFDLVFTHPRIHTREEAEARLRAIEVDPEQMMIVEDVEEDEK